MCTAISFRAKHHYFGRNLDLEYSYQETVTITPRNCPFTFRKMGVLKRHYAMIGMAYVREGYPLYYDGTNEKGLSMAGLMFAGNAYYRKEGEWELSGETDLVSPFELIPWILGQCSDIEEALEKLRRMQLVEIHFSEELKLTPLHWMLADRKRCLVIEPLKEGVQIYENSVNVLTNNPPFPYQMMGLNGYRGLSRKEPPCTFAKGVELLQISRGMGALGLPGDLSSASRFARAAFHVNNAEEGADEQENVNHFFHLLGSVEMPKGSVELENGALEYTIYTSCCDADRGIYYYSTYENRSINGVDMYREDLEGSNPISYLLRRQRIEIQN